MTTPAIPDHKSMRFALHEVLAGTLATIEADHFSDDHTRLAALIEELAGRFSMFAPMGAGVDPAALAAALELLEQRQFITHGDGQYVLSTDGRNKCVGSKRTLFNQHDREELEAAAESFSSLA